MDDRPVLPVEPSEWADLAAADTPELDAGEERAEDVTGWATSEAPETPVVPVTGHPAVDAALAVLTGVDGAPPEEQLAAYRAVHQSLQETLATIDQE